MVSLIDIGPLREKVQLRGHELEVRGLSADFIFTLLTKSNELRLLIAQRQLDPENVMELINQAPVAVAEGIAFALNKQGDPETIAFALTELTAGETALLITPILKVTFPQGVQSFMDGLRSLAPDATGGPGWAAAMKSPEASSDASEQATTAAQPGAIPQDRSEPGAS